ncbi:homing endonuclease [Aeromonas phage AsFcp_2]|nr:homing endonuclease [Aeromonas phage AsFcp_2]
MNYEKQYFNLVNSRKQRAWTKESAPCYTESHHIIPKSRGGTDDETNLVRLTAREHILAHLLLAKSYGGKYWQTAYGMIFDKNGERQPSRMLSIIRENGKRNISDMMKGNKNGLGHKCSDETKLKLSNMFKGRTYSDEIMNKYRAAGKRRRGSKQSPESNLKRSASLKSHGFVPVRAGDFDVCSKAGKANKGVKKPPRTLEHILNMAAAKSTRYTVICGVKYDSVKRASIELNISVDKIKRRCANETDFSDWYFINKEVMIENT